MKWFFKVIRHYADFNGRARRKEYWYYVLFYVIFSFLWGIITALIYAGIRNPDNYVDNILIYYYPSLSLSIIMLLPGMAVAVRRLHDLGKSGWMLLITLIPLVGGIWFFIQMITDGEDGTNKYGPDPKTSNEIFEEQMQLKSIGITFIVASILHFLSSTFAKHVTEYQMTGIESFFHNILSFDYITIWDLSITILDSSVTILLLVAGVFLLNGKSISDANKNTKTGFILTMLACAIASGLSIFFMTNLLKISKNPDISISWTNYTNNFIYIAFWVSAFLLIASQLFLQKNSYLIRILAIVTITLSSIILPWNVCFKMSNMGHTKNPLFICNDILHLLALSLMLCAFILLAGALLKGKKAISPPPYLE